MVLFEKMVLYLIILMPLMHLFLIINKVKEVVLCIAVMLYVPIYIDIHIDCDSGNVFEIYSSLDIFGD